MDTLQADLPVRVAHLLGRAAQLCGKTHAQIARCSGLKRDTIRRSLAGERPVSLTEVITILEATGLPGEQTLLFMLLAGEEFALESSGTGAAQFLGELFKRIPIEIFEQLGDDIVDLRPRWANGTAKLLARTLNQHIADLNRRGDLIGDP